MNIGIFGRAGCGKGVASKYLSKKYGFKVINYGDTIRALARKNRVRPTRRNLEKLQVKYSKKIGRDYATAMVEKRLKKLNRPAILEGIRKPEQAITAKKRFGAKLIFIDADLRVRFERMKKRRRAGFEKTFEEFERIENQEEKVFRLGKTFRYADYTADNSKGKQHLFSQLDRIMKKINSRRYP